MSPAIQILCISFALLFVGCDRDSPDAEAQSNSDQTPNVDSPAAEPFQQAESGNDEEEIKPKDW